MNEPTHLDIFTGIGGFAIAARWAGFRTVAMCESDARCRAFLEKRWGLPVAPDIRKLDAGVYRGVSLLTGGPPCQPASRAGKQRGSEDDRWLWGEALRVLAEAKPDSVVFENPLGIGDVGLDGILSEMGRLGYEVQCFDIPACAVDSPQLRHRIWIAGFLANSSCERRQQNSRGSHGYEAANEGRSAQHDYKPASDGKSELAESRCERSGQDEPERGAQGRAVDRRACANELADAAEPGREGRDAKQGSDGRSSECPQSLVADTERERRQRRGESSERTEGWRSQCPTDGLCSERTAWSDSVWVPCADGKLRRAPDDSFHVAHGLHRSILGALGNSIVPALAYQILTAVKKVLDEEM